MGTKLKPLKPNTTVPAPGNYEPNHDKVLKSLPSYSMKVKLASVLVNEKGMKTPGPGNYNLHLNNKKAAPRFGFGSSKREGPT